MDEAGVRAACEQFSWRSWRDSLAELASLVGTDPSTFWSLLRNLIERALTPEDAEEYSPGLLALFSLDPGWEKRVSEAARMSHKVATALANSVDVLAPRAMYDLMGREFVVQAWFSNVRAWGTRAGDETPWEFWAWEVVEGSTSWGTPDEQWDLVLALIAAANSEHSLSAVAAGPLEDFVQDDWRFALQVIEREAPRNAALGRALAGVNLPFDIPDDAGQRFRALVVPPKS